MKLIIAGSRGLPLTDIEITYAVIEFITANPKPIIHLNKGPSAYITELVSGDATGNRNLEAKRAAEAQSKTLRKALVFATSVIRCGESWTETCDEIIGGALDLHLDL